MPHSMPHSIRFLSLALLLAALSGCATMTAEQCDPRTDAGFLGKMGCVSQGVYAQRVEDKEQILLDEQKTNQLFREVHAALAHERASVGEELADERQRHAALNAALTALLGEIKSKTAGNQRIQADVAAIERDMANLERQSQQESTSVLERRLELQKVTDRVARLQEELGLSPP